MRLKIAACAFAMICLAPVAHGQEAAPPLTFGDLTVSGSVRARAYSWNWFGSDPSGDYSYPGALFRLAFSQNRKAYDWLVELGAPVIVGLPSTAVQAAPKGQLGLGGSYFAANSNSTDNASLFIKQAAVRFKGLGGVEGQSLKVGRIEFGDGGEVTPKNASLAVVKRERINQRLIGTFGFTDVGRSFDGAQYTNGTAKTNVTILAARPTQGVFQVDGWGELNINVFYGSVTGQVGNGGNVAGEWRIFGIGYQDYRHGVAKTDNRPAAVRNADTGDIDIGTYGGHYIEVANTRAGPVDVLLWGVVQNGSWGSLAQRSGAFAAEAGWQPAGIPSLKPWIRGGYNYGSGDSDPNDQKHGTFFQVLYTPRVYARTPFFNQMNNKDAFVEFTVRPSTRLAIRSDVHSLKMASSADFWYSGGGAFQPSTFGFNGRSVNNNSDLSTLWDLSGDITINQRAAVGLYYGHAAGGAIPQAIYSSSDALRLVYAELFLHF
jgi:hypothetical protein